MGISQVERALQALALELPPPKTPVANYVGTKQSGDLLFVSGRVSQVRGEVGTDLDTAAAKLAARDAMLDVLAIVKQEHRRPGSDRIRGEAERVCAIIRTLHRAAARYRRGLRSSRGPVGRSGASRKNGNGGRPATVRCGGTARAGPSAPCSRLSWSAANSGKPQPGQTEASQPQPGHCLTSDCYCRGSHQARALRPRSPH